MNILYCGDKGISRGALVSILSILKHNKGEIHFYILTINYETTVAFEEKTAKFLDELVKKTNKKSSVKLIDATDVFVKNLPKKN
ncbi:glycosyltransferase family 8 protein, partial [Candidatus Saccharibacteria bacterium]|nr:glycosyltransferase family 8 protein [Candidatus Saccharibacteria bacterium]